VGRAGAGRRGRAWGRRLYRVGSPRTRIGDMLDAHRRSARRARAVVEELFYGA